MGLLSESSVGVVWGLCWQILFGGLGVDVWGVGGFVVGCWVYVWFLLCVGGVVCEEVVCVSWVIERCRVRVLRLVGRVMCV